MKDNNALQNINIAFDESKGLLEDAILIKEQEATDAAKKPTSFMASAFGGWLYSDGLSFGKYPWFNPIMELHQRVYESYSKLYHGADKVDDIPANTSQFEKLIIEYQSKLDEAKAELTDDPVDTNDTTEVDQKTSHIEKNDDETIITQPELPLPKGKSKTEELMELLEQEKKVKNNSDTLEPAVIKESFNEVETKTAIEHSVDNTSDKVVDEQTISDELTQEHLAIQSEIQQQKEKQLLLRQEMVKQELSQIEDRQKLFQKSIDQLAHHQTLKEKENTFAVETDKKKLQLLSKQKSEKRKDLKIAQENKISTQQELEQMETASADFEKAGIEEQNKGKEKLQELSKEQNTTKIALQSISQQQDKKRKALEELKKRVLVAESELDGLLEDELNKLDEERVLSEKKLDIQRDIEGKLVKQQQDRDKYLQLEEMKYQSLQHFKKQYFSIQQEILHLEHDQQNTRQNKDASAKTRLKEVDQLKGQLKRKQEMLDVLHSEYQLKIEKLEKLTTQESQSDEIIDDAEELRKLFALDL